MDHDEVSTLLGIVEKAAAHSGKLSAIMSAAMNRLMEINEDLRQESIAAAAQRAEDEAAKAIPASTFDEGDEDPSVTPPRESETDKLAKSNMRRV